MKTVAELIRNYYKDRGDWSLEMIHYFLGLYETGTLQSQFTQATLFPESIESSLTISEGISKKITQLQLIERANQIMISSPILSRARTEEQKKRKRKRKQKNKTRKKRRSDKR